MFSRSKSKSKSNVILLPQFKNLKEQDEYYLGIAIEEAKKGKLINISLSIIIIN